MRVESQSGKAQPVQIVAADMLDRMNETDSLIAQRVYEIFESRGGAHGSHRDDWFGAKHEVLAPVVIQQYVTDSTLRLVAHLPGFDAEDLEVAIGHRRAVICGVHLDSDHPGDIRRGDPKVMRIVELPFEVDSALSRATIEMGTLQVVLPRAR